MSMYEQFRTDTDLEKNGVDVDYGPFVVTVARAGGSNRKFAQTVNRLSQPYRRAIQTETMDERMGQRLLMQAYAQVIVQNWQTRVDEEGRPSKDGEELVQGIEGPEGDLLSFTVENVMMTFENLPDIFNDVVEMSQKAAIYRVNVDEDDSGN